MRKIKMLYVLNVAQRVNSFSYTSMLAAQELNLEYHIAGNWGYASKEARQADERAYGIHIHQIDFIRSPLNPGNRKAYRQLDRLMGDEDFDIVHVNTPIGGVLGRLAAKKHKIRRVIYQAHGFHFYRGASPINWLFYYPVERWLARMTDALITINREDFDRAEGFRLRGGGKRYYVPGVGIDVSAYQAEGTERDAARWRRRAELGLEPEDFALIAVGRLDRNKNVDTLIAAVAKSENKKVHLVICGEGEEEARLRGRASALGLEKQVHFLGNRSDMPELYRMADAFAMGSYREGLSRSLMEAMASGLPSIVSNIRGNVDLIRQGETGYLCSPQSADDYAKAINRLYESAALRADMAREAREAVKAFDIASVRQALKSVYASMLAERGRKES